MTDEIHKMRQIQKNFDVKMTYLHGEWEQK